MRCGFVAEHQGIGLSIRELCCLVDVARSIYYHWCAQSEKRDLNAREEAGLLISIKKVFHGSKEAQGSPRVWRQL